jgi:hypothetical protein
MRLSVSQLFTDYINAQPLEAIGFALDDGGDAAEAVRGVAVPADEVPRAGGGILAPLTVFRGGDLPQSGQTRLKIQNDLVDSRHDDHMGGAEYHGGHAVAAGIDIDQFPVQGQGIGAGEETVRMLLESAHRGPRRPGLFLPVVVDFLASLYQGFRDAHLPDGDRAAEPDRCFPGDLTQNFLCRFAGAGVIKGTHAAFFQSRQSDLDVIRRKILHDSRPFSVIG